MMIKTFFNKLKKLPKPVKVLIVIPFFIWWGFWILIYSFVRWIGFFCVLFAQFSLKEAIEYWKFTS